MDQPKVTIIIPTYNDNERLALCLDAIANQTYPLELIEVSVVDNNSDTSCEPVVKNYSFAEYLFEAQPGSYHARNTALSTGSLNDIVAFTDSDCIPEPEWLANAINAILSTSDKLGAVGGKVTMFASSDEPNLAELYDIVTGFDQVDYIQKEHFAVTANLVTKRSVIEANGLFNAELKSSGDKDWCQRMVKAGFDIQYCSEAVVKHPARTSISSIKTKLRRLYGGFYYNHLYKKRDRLFTLLGLFEALMPPVKFYKKVKQVEKNRIITQKINLFLFAYKLKLYTLIYRIKLITGLEKNIETN